MSNLTLHIHYFRCNPLQLRRTDTQKVPKPYQMPARSLSMQCLTSTTETYLKSDLIAELKISKDIPGIKKMKVEQQMANRMDSEHYMEITKQFTANNYVDQVSCEAYTRAGAGAGAGVTKMRGKDLLADTGKGPGRQCHTRLEAPDDGQEGG